MHHQKKQDDRNKRAKGRESRDNIYRDWKSIRNSSLSFNSDQDSCDASKTESVVASPIPLNFYHLSPITSVADEIENFKTCKVKVLTDLRVYFRLCME